MSATSPSLSAPTSHDPGATAWWAVVTLGLGIFTLVGSEFLPASMLSPIAADVGVSEGVAGQLVTSTAIAGIVAGPALIAILPPVDRRWVMISLTGLSIASNLLVAVAPSFALMLAGRALLGVSLSGFWALSLAVVAQLVPARQLGRAMMIVNTGVSLATVAAVPVGAYLGAQVGWRAVFLAAAAVGAVTLLLQLAALPNIAATERTGLRPLVDTLRTPVIAAGFGGLALLVVGHFTAFTYVRPLLDLVDGIDATVLAVLLAAFGVAAFVGNLLAGSFADRRLRVVLVVVPLLIAGPTATLSLAGGRPAVTAAGIVAWGVGFGAVPTMVQTWIARVAPERLESAGSLTVTVFQISIAAGAALGGILSDTSGVRAAFLAAGVAAAAGALVFSRVRTGPARMPAS